MSRRETRKDVTAIEVVDFLLNSGDTWASGFVESQVTELHTLRAELSNVRQTLRNRSKGAPLMLSLVALVNYIADQRGEARSDVVTLHTRATDAESRQSVAQEALGELLTEHRIATTESASRIAALEGERNEAIERLVDVVGKATRHADHCVGMSPTSPDESPGPVALLEALKTHRIFIGTLAPTQPDTEGES